MFTGINRESATKFLPLLLSTMFLLLVSGVNGSVAHQTTDKANSTILVSGNAWKAFDISASLSIVKPSLKKRQMWRKKMTQGTTILKYKAKMNMNRMKIRRIKRVTDIHFNHSVSVVSKTAPAKEINFARYYKWPLKPSEYIYNNNSLRVIMHNISYDIGHFIITNDSHTAYVCIPEVLSPEFAYLDLVVFVDWFISLGGILLTMFTHGFLLHRRRQHPIKPFMNYCICLLLLFVALVVRQVTRDCLILEITVNIGVFCMLASAAWLNVVSLDLYRRFHPVTMFQSFSLVSAQKRFFFQSLYSWGVPFACWGTAFGLRFLNLPKSEAWSCYSLVLSNVAQLFFLETAFGILALLNDVCVIITVKNIYTTRKEVRDRNVHSGETCIVSVYLRLMVATGIFWVLQTLRQTMIRFKPQSHIWILTDLLSGAQGLWLFIIYCCNPSVIKLIQEEIRKSRH